MNIENIFSNNYDVYKNILDFPEDKSALSGSNKLLHRLAQYAHEREEYPKLDRLLRTMLDEPGISVTQKAELQTLFFQLQDRIAPLSYGADAISIDGDFADRTKRAIATIVLDRATNPLPLPQKEALAYEIQGAASAYEALSKYFDGVDGISAMTVIDAFRPLPRHYLQCMFDLLDGRQPETYWKKIVDLLCGIHQMLCKHGDMNVARLVYSKAYGLLCTWNTTIVYGYLGYMLAQQGDYDDALQMSEDYLPPHVRRYFFEKVAIIASENGDFDRALRFLEAVDEERMAPVTAIYHNAIVRGQWDYALCVIEFADDDEKDHLYQDCARKAALSGDYDRAMDIAMYISDAPVKDQCCHNIILRAARNARTKEKILGLLTKLDISMRHQIVAVIIREAIDVSDDGGREVALYYAEKSPVEEDKRRMLWWTLFRLFIRKNVRVDLIYDVWKNIPWTHDAVTHSKECALLILDFFAKKGDFTSAMYFLDLCDDQGTLELTKKFLRNAERRNQPNLDEAMTIFLEKYGDDLFAIETFGRSSVSVYYTKKGDIAKAVEIANNAALILLEMCEVIARRDFREAVSFVDSHFEGWCSDMSLDGTPHTLKDVVAGVLKDMIAGALARGLMHQGNKYFAQKVAYRIQSERMKQEALQEIVKDDTASFFSQEFLYDEREIEELLDSFFGPRMVSPVSI